MSLAEVAALDFQRPEKVQRLKIVLICRQDATAELRGSIKMTGLMQPERLAEPVPAMSRDALSG